MSNPKLFDEAGEPRGDRDSLQTAVEIRLEIVAGSEQMYTRWTIYDDDNLTVIEEGEIFIPTNNAGYGSAMALLAACLKTAKSKISPFP